MLMPDFQSLQEGYGAHNRLEARPLELKEDRATIEGILTSGGKVTATCRGLFIRVKKDHPAYQHW